MPDIQVRPWPGSPSSGGNFFDQFDAPASQPNTQAANAIGGMESGNNYQAVGPDAGKGRGSAIGKYQVMPANVGPWTKEAIGFELTPEQFAASPAVQDAVFQHKFVGQYLPKYGPEGAAKAWFAGETGMQDPNRRDVNGTSVASYGQNFSNQMSAKTGSNFFDQFDGQPAQQQAPSFSDRFAQATPQVDNPAMQSGLQARGDEMMRGPSQGPMAQMATDFDNVLPSAMQGTTPNVDAYKGKLISNQAFEGDDGSIQYRDPQTGQVVPTDTKTQVAIRDPRDGTVKIFSRSDDTNEGVAVGVSRVLSQGMAAGTPVVSASAVPQAARKGQEVVSAANRLGVSLPRAVTTDSTAVQRLAAGTRNIPLAGDPLINSTQRAVSQIGSKATNIATSIGSGEAAAAGDAAKGAITNYITGVTAERSRKLYDAVDNLVDNSRTVPLVNTRMTVREIMSRRANAAIGADSKAVGTVLEAVDRPQGLNYQGVKDLRSSVGEMVKSGILPEGMSGQELKQIYSSLSDDLKSTVRVAGGTEASAAFERANRYYRLVSDRRAQLAKIVGEAGDVPAERVFDRLTTMAGNSGGANIGLLAKARKAIGAEDWGEFASGVVARMGRDPAFAGPERISAENFSPQRFATAYGKLSDHGRNVLFSSGATPGLSRDLKDLATISERWKELQKFSNPSGTAQNMMFGMSGAGLIASPLTTIGSLVGGRLLAAVLSKPASLASTAQWSRSYERLVRSPSPAAMASFQIASRNLVTNLRDIGVSITPSDLMKSIQGPVNAAADDEEPKPVGVGHQ